MSGWRDRPAKETVTRNSQGGKARPGHRRVAQWTRDYIRLPGIPNEYIGQDGVPREVWTRFFEAFAHYRRATSSGVSEPPTGACGKPA